MAEEKTEGTRNKKSSVLDSEPLPTLWKDRKRYLGMPISFTRYEIDDERLISRIGFFRTTVNEILLYRIMDIKFSRSLWQKIFGVGTITLFTADQSDSQIRLHNIAKSEKVWRFISNKVEAERNQRRIVGRELYGAAIPSMVDIDGDGIPD